MSLVRKISIGRDYKNDAMHYSVGQEVYGNHFICDIVESDHKFSIFIKKITNGSEFLKFNKNVFR